jgi:D-alanyl-D-alanine dipeptidase
MQKSRPYHHIPIEDLGEILTTIPLHQFSVITPHPYQQAGASYHNYSPYHLRQGVIDRLLLAQEYLQTQKPGWQLAIFDGYRPVAVQQYMVDFTFGELVQTRGWQRASLTPDQEESLWELVHQIWAIPNYDPTTPPPHSTGGAVDLALADATGAMVDFGSPIDEISPRSHPDYYLDYLNCLDRHHPEYFDHLDRSLSPDQDARPNPPDTQNLDPNLAQTYHQNRLLLKAVMEQAGFQRHPGEWWHFCYGDQMWAWLSEAPRAIYGRVEE